METYTPLGAHSVALACVARTLSVEASWISAATVPMLTMFTCAGEVTEASTVNFTYCIWVQVKLKCTVGSKYEPW